MAPLDCRANHVYTHYIRPPVVLVVLPSISGEQRERGEGSFMQGVNKDRKSNYDKRTDLYNLHK